MNPKSRKFPLRIPLLSNFYKTNSECDFQALVSKEKKLNDDVLQNIVYKTFTTKVDVLNCYGPDLVKHLEESVKSWNINSPEYSAWAYLLQICCQEVRAEHFIIALEPYLESNRRYRSIK